MGQGPPPAFSSGVTWAASPTCWGPNSQTTCQVAQQAGALMKNQIRLSTTQNRRPWGQVSRFLLVPIKLLLRLRNWVWPRCTQGNSPLELTRAWGLIRELQPTGCAQVKRQQVGVSGLRPEPPGPMCVGGHMQV